jgi:hypothetical protein
MSRLDEIPPDQRAALSLLLRQRKSYAEVARLLGIDERAVHDRAQAALAMLAPRQARDVPADRRLEIGDYLLSQQPGVAERLRTRTFLGTSEPARAWATELAAQLAPLAGEPLPEIPAPSAAAAAPDQPQRVQDLSSTAPASAGAASGQEAKSAAQSSSRLGGALILGAIAAAAIVAIVLIVSGGSGSSHKKTASKTATSTTGTSTTASSSKTKGPKVTARLALRSPAPGSRSVGAVDILQESGKRAFFIEAQHLPASKGFFYAIWLYNSHTSSLPLSKSPAVGSSHKLAGGALLPSNAGDFKEMLLTKETSTHPTHPGHVVLRGPFRLEE